MAQSAEEYDAEQEKLLHKSEGEPSDDDVRLDIPKGPEVNPEVYRDVVPLLFRGFLTISAEINNVQIVFKSLNQHEFEMVRLLGGYTGDNATTRFWNMFLAYGVFVIDGQNVLVDRHRWMPKIAETFNDMQPGARSKVIRHLSELNRRAANATILTEAYAMENYSRYRWAQVHGLDLTLPAVTGIGGTDQIGLNWAQLAWRALNYFEDMSQTHERDWENAKFVGSCSAGKGISKVYNRDHDRHRKEAEDRIARKDRVLRHVFEGVPLDEDKVLRNGQVVQVAQTVEQLADQLEKTLRGEKDWHDEVVDAHEKRVRDQVQAQQAQRIMLAEESERKFEGRRVLGGTDMQGLTPQQAQERVQRARQIEAQKIANGFVYPDAEGQEKMERFLDRHGLLGPQIETTVETSDRDTSDVLPLPPPRDRGKPWRP